MKTDKCLSADHNKSDDLCSGTHNCGFTIQTGTKHNQKSPMQKKLCTVFVSRVVEKLRPLEHAPNLELTIMGSKGLLEGVNILQLAY